MPGGLMNLVSQGQQNIVLNGNPTKSFFKATYRQYTNFGLQKFRVDFEGAKTLRLTEPSHFEALKKWRPDKVLKQEFL